MITFSLIVMMILERMSHFSLSIQSKTRIIYSVEAEKAIDDVYSRMC